ncbi:arsenite efflux transporter metallochaperone ArsD [Aminipila butyrica]|uniref:Arsenite efflux transporter metallochaperone ArsD n=1 Tax=Aminipila butyrica TaxID=433296 RepID=A0A858BXI3_9FIRM|nr:arsenite efflux transporter metallochaperone ArsD [Aminipila butyrica]QIB69424.1 arsenite efflux transporter metallochaperone ArsD [Aminipila butyrica]
MKKMIIFDPAMCCSTGVCGPSVNPELLRVATTLNKLNNKGIIVDRYNLASSPQAFVDNSTINTLINSEGIDILPVTILDNEVVKIKEYPSNNEFCEMLELPLDTLKSTVKAKPGCGCKGGCCQ